VIRILITEAAFKAVASTLLAGAASVEHQREVGAGR